MSAMQFTELKDILAEMAAGQLADVAAWHESEPLDEPVAIGEATAQALRGLIRAEHLVNFRLWHVEDEARRTDVGPEVIADCKRRIDGLNQRRNDLIEQVDTCIAALIKDVLPADAADLRNTETLGSAMDRLSIMALKTFHMREQAQRAEAGEEHVRQCAEKAGVLVAQRDDLLKSALWLVDEFQRGEKTPGVNYQFKMYNDPALNPLLYGQGAGEREK